MAEICERAHSNAPDTHVGGRLFTIARTVRRLLVLLGLRRSSLSQWVIWLISVSALPPLGFTGSFTVIPPTTHGAPSQPRFRAASMPPPPPVDGQQERPRLPRESRLEDTAAA